MLKKMIPNLHTESIHSIDYKRLQEQGITSIIVDLDNTLVEVTKPNASPRLLNWFAQLKEIGFKVIIVSNNTRMRVSRFADPLDIPFIYLAKKPFTRAFRLAIKILDSKPEQTAVIGDQLLTDVFGGNRAGMYTILVTPISAADTFFTKVNRKIERRIFYWMKKNGYQGWGPF